MNATSGAARPQRGCTPPGGRGSNRDWVQLVAALLACATPSIARAQQQPAQRDPIAAEALFERGKTWMDHGRVAEACAAFAESQRLDPAGGTLLRLALCHEQEKKLASAWSEFHEVERMSKEEGTGEPAKLAERIRIAREHITAIGPRLPQLTISVPPAARVAGLSVTANGMLRNEGSWSVPIPTDPGEVEIVATAPSRRTFRATAHVTEGHEARFDLPPLALDTPPTFLPPPANVEARPSMSSTRIFGIVAGAVGVGAIGVGSYFGVRAISKSSDANAACPGSSCDSGPVALENEAKTDARISDVAVGAGIVVVAIGVVLFVVGAPKDVESRASGVAVAF